MNKRPHATTSPPDRESDRPRDVDSRIPLTAIVLTLDEEINIRRCLSCLATVDDIVLVDSGSRDRTVAIAQEARSSLRIFEHAFQDFGDQRNWALDNTSPKNDWILFVDADEFCTHELLSEIDSFIRSPGTNVGAFIAGRYYFLGRWIKHATLYPSYQLRLLRQGQVRFRKEGHGQREVTQGALHYLRESWVHEGLGKGIHQWIDRHNCYSTDEVDLNRKLRQEPLRPMDLTSGDAVVRRRALKRLATRLPLRSVTRFLYVYLFKRGFLDGAPGLLYCLLRFTHDIHIAAKTVESDRSAGLDSGSRKPKRP